ncbi:hypothetical protein R1flu_024655 [Riccia fluitans]|uniref:Uncharacterized protein n=1 Tax=Riccia fluitans TaxID=41844 RepID=A0ABD1XWF3_9MARC
MKEESLLLFRLALCGATVDPSSWRSEGGGRTAECGGERRSVQAGWLTADRSREGKRAIAGGGRSKTRKRSSSMSELTNEALFGSAKEPFSQSGHSHGHGGRAKLPMLPLIALIFYEVSGGPFGVEDSVKAGGPLLTLLGFIIFPLLWSVPEALVTAELATAFPVDGGYVVWISAAFGEFWGFQEGWWKWLSGVIDNALYPVLFLDYLKQGLPIFEERLPRMIALVLLTVVLTYLNYRGLTIVGYTAVALAVFSLLPFGILTLLAVPKIKPERWLMIDLATTDWRGYLNNLFWNLNYWDSVSTLAGEVDQPKKNFPKALGFAGVLVVLGYLIPLLAGIGAISDDHRDDWEDGYFAQVGMLVGGAWLAWWITAAAAMSNLGLFQAEMSSDSYQLLGMGERGMLPEVFSRRSQYGTPILGILCSATANP